MQEFGSWWSSALPVLQLAMTGLGSALGAVIGGMVAIKTTTRALEAAAEREQIAREHARRKDIADALQVKAERYHSLLWSLSAFQADLHDRITVWANVAGLPDQDSTFELHISKSVFTEMKALEVFDLRVMRGTSQRIFRLMGPFFDLNWHEIYYRRQHANGWPTGLAEQYMRRSTELQNALNAFIEQAAEDLVVRVALARSELLQAVKAAGQ
ncbi:hypothetical protein [Roseateles chitinivorans]|uniref:hypothetical protein n=1 Tax=Roseateles chitinivorans TaxID=2917965 RepID=UPI00117FF94D|nr:hypothetical protein [Roseateles chitinivorans]